ncbi:fumarate reductase subunit FrdD [uncultured Ruminobacter sp.]|jgi:fumarate reductase subunit D|uniref:fumarate reductase subunit FrdD n=1 Tax=Ruminobacter sp. TaxID=2774296 RepID=UPI0025FC272E|nr:fumarate reductase subunit FrdD [uncultured Ruminobacter sp.]
MSTRRSDEPIYWGLFGFGGMVIAFALPAILTLMILQGFGVDCFKLAAIAKTWWGAGALFVIVSAPLWHGFHRIYHGLHDLCIHTTRVHHYVLYGLAAIFSLAALVIYASKFFGWCA